MAQFEGKVAVVTGGSRGIGRAIALAFGRAGARVAVTCSRQREAAEEVVAALQQMGSTGQVFQCGVADYTATTVAFEEIVKTFPLMTVVGGKVTYLRTEFAKELGLEPKGFQLRYDWETGKKSRTGE